ncbi:LysM peptidoglycan-binding domain-containing protein [Fibrobacterota bacterium]
MMKKPFFFLSLLICFLLWSFLASKDVHIAKPGDTLWDLSGFYLQDPFKWQEIWQINPEIQNPHLIYPGDEINLQVSGEYGSRQDRSLSFNQKTEGLQRKTGNKKADNMSPLAPSQGKIRYLLPDIIQKAPFLAEPRKNGAIFNKEADFRFRSATDATVLQLFSKIEIELGSMQGVKPGDFFQVYAVGKKYRSYENSKKLGSLVSVKGVAEVKKSGEETSQGVLTSCFGAISRSARVSPLKKERLVGIKGYHTYPDRNRTGQVVYIEENHETVLPYSYVIIDKGSQAGFAMADGVVIYNRSPVRKKPTDTLLGKGIIVKLSEVSASVLVKTVFPGKLNNGDYVVAVHSAEIVGG